MSRIAKADVSAALDRAAKNITDAAGRDGVVSRKDIKTKLETLTGTEKQLTDRFFRFIDHRDYKTGARITKSDVDRALTYAKQHLLEKYDVNNNGFSKSEIAKMSVTGQLSVALAAEAKGVTLDPTTSTSALGDKFTVAAKDTYFLSESDSQPAFIQHSYAKTKAITGDDVMTAFSSELKKAFDENDRDLSKYIATVKSGTEAQAFLTDLATWDPATDDGYKDMAAGFARIKGVFDQNLTDVSVVRVGPRDDSDPTKMGEDDGAYQYLVLGRTADNKLAGVIFESVET